MDIKRPGMNPVFVQGPDLDWVYFSLLREIWERGRVVNIDEGSFKGAKRLEFDFASGFIHRPHETENVAPTFPPNVAPVTTDEKIRDYLAEYLMNSDLLDGEEYRYSQWINGRILEYPAYCRKVGCEHLKIKALGIPHCKNQNMYDDIQTWVCPENRPNTPYGWVVSHFREKGYGNNHCYINIGSNDMSLNYDRPYSNEMARKTSPCLRGIDFKIKEGRLIMSVVFRSWDLYAGFPENMGGFILLNRLMAQDIGVEPGPLGFSSSGLHAYDYQIDQLLARIGVS